MWSVKLEYHEVCQLQVFQACRKKGQVNKEDKCEVFVPIAAPLLKETIFLERGDMGFVTQNVKDLMTIVPR